MRGDCVGGRDPPGVATPRSASPLRARAPNAAAQFRCNICLALDLATRRESVVDEYKHRCDPSSVRRDIFVDGGAAPRAPFGIAFGLIAREEAFTPVEHVRP